LKRFAAFGAVLFAVAACQDATSPRPTAGTPSRPNAAQAGAANNYIVVFQSDETDPAGQANALVRAHGGSLLYVYRNTIKGFAVANLPDAAIEALEQNPRVAYIERDGIMTADDTQLNPPSWGLDRIDAADGLDLQYTYPSTGAGVRAYILDTGINASHNDFAGRVGSGVDFIDGGAPDDCHGHGTHVAGTVGGTAYGVAKGVTLVAVRVLNCQGSGTTSGVIAGVDWVGNAAKPAVANMSLGGSYWQALNDAVSAATAKGVTFAVAAGNSNANACNYSPSSTPEAITVGATTEADARASYSNYGTCVDIMAPGSLIKSAWIGSATASNTISGTSMASPHVAGAAALVLGSNLGFTPTQVRDALVNGATNNTLATLPTGTPNKLLFVGTPGEPPPPPPPPGFTASFTKSCSGLSCTFTSTTAGATQWVWSFGDGTPNVTGVSSVTHPFAARASYTVTLTASNSTASDVATVGVTCNPRKCQ
jgi:subtilisin family serine protease